LEKDFIFDNELDNEFDQELDEQVSCLKDADFYLTETYFYPPSDDRVWASNIEDVDGGDNFVDYCQYIFNVLDEEEYYDN
jgi:hypothetical protein